MDTTTATAAASSAATKTATSSGADKEANSGASALSSDFETFLTMLTAQMQNQDPLNPMESTDFAVQLATFSGVEQQVQTNDLLKTLSSQQSLSGLSSVAGWIGMEAKVAAPVAFDGTPVTLYPQMPAGTEQAALVVTDSNGTEVARMAMPASNDPVVWGGTDASGAPLPAGSYSLAVEAQKGGEVVATEPVEHYAQVVEARMKDGAPALVFASGAEIAASDVGAVRLPRN